jgi:predicted  nucleic acid-binding Zn-ribbon protein
MQTLPKVAKSFQQECKKCETQRFHRVLAHIDAKSAKVECETCHKKSTLKLGPARAKRGSAALANKQASTAAQIHEWQKLAESNKSSGKSYSITARFAVKDKIDHPKFGVGFVLASVPGRVTALFESGEKTLIQGN